MLRLADHEEEALAELYHLYSRQIFSVAYKVLGSSEEAEEVLQDTFCRAWQHAAAYDPQKASPFGWLVLLGRRIAIDRLRKNRRKPQHQTIETEQNADLDDQYDGVDVGVLSRELNEALLRKLRALSPNQRQCIELAFYQGFTQHEIAEQLNRPVGSVKSDIRRGLIRLRGMMANPND